MDAVVRPPGSKSITNRALLVASLARGQSVLGEALHSDDTLAMADALSSLGIHIEADGEARAFTVDGCDGKLSPGPAAVYVGQAGTAARFLPPLLALGSGFYDVDGSPRMRERPMAPLLAALRELGVPVSHLEGSAGLPIRVEGRSGLVTGVATIDGSMSSQFLSGLLLSAPCFRSGLDITVTGEFVSRPYLDVTLAVMRAFGATVRDLESGRYAVDPGRYHGRSYAIEPDASAASYFFAAAAITGGRVRIEGLGTRSPQGDLAFVAALEAMGSRVEMSDGATVLIGPARLTGIDVNMRDFSDTAQTLAVVAAFADSPTRVTGIDFIRRKETDRVAAVVRELRRVGVGASEDPDGFTIVPSAPTAGRIATYDDHRMAMSFSLLGLGTGGIEIENPTCVSKTYPNYFADLSDATGVTVAKHPD
jgi:3-phosphoshikimate 1-carboxyvinyltransferase